MKTTNPFLSIRSVGVFLPEVVRTNDWWSERIIDHWAEKSRQRIQDSGTNKVTPTLPDGGSLVLAAMEELRDDPFHGSVERRVMPPDMLPSHMELNAAREALERAGLEAKDLDFVITASWCPDMLGVPNAVAVHDMLGMRPDCLSTSLEVGCNGFLQQLALAEGLVAAGRWKRGILIQSTAMGSRLIPHEEPHAPWFGDGATAVIVERAEGSTGLLGAFEGTDGKLRNALHTGVPGKQWYEEGRTWWHHGDKRAAFEMLLRIPDCARISIDGALQSAGLTRSDLTFLACHQATPWFRKVVQRHMGLENVRSFDTFKFAGSLVSSNIPLVLRSAENEGLLRRGDIVAMHAGGSGITFSAAVVRW